MDDGRRSDEQAEAEVNSQPNASYRFDNKKRRRPENDDRQRHLTPNYLLEPIRVALGGQIDLDPCTELDNPTQAREFYTPPLDGCAQDWRMMRNGAPIYTIFCNPPYGEARGRWVEKCIEASRLGARVVLLIPAHTETRIFQKALGHCSSVCFLRARVRFANVRNNGRHEAASHGSAVLGYRVNLQFLEEQKLGLVLRA